MTAAGVGIGAAAVAGMRGLLRKQTSPVSAQAAAQSTVNYAETDEQKQQRLYEEESRKLANELREFDAQLASKDQDSYRAKLKREGLWKD